MEVHIFLVFFKKTCEIMDGGSESVYIFCLSTDYVILVCTACVPYMQHVQERDSKKISWLLEAPILQSCSGGLKGWTGEEEEFKLVF